ncbi:hypothetical protein TNCT_493911 [Trichonephila clavata]|uniref:Uncharacterized protein n=1 Tax=Trichonephila clavata TaxID=2740835 RepID=A0A8X6HY78_TRICU|nr:hypothetical protein TNCT_493911 [Trichonephila clavata]
MEIDHKPGSSRPVQCDWTIYGRKSKPGQRQWYDSYEPNSLYHHKLLTFGSNGHGETAQNMGITCPNEEATSTTPGDL